MTVSPGWATTVVGLNARTPGPPTTTRWSVPVGVGGGVEVEVEGGGVDVTAGGVEAGGLLPAIAAALKAANLSPGFTAKTIPCWQWFAWRQNAQIG